jgi:hypothetical protein
MAKGVRGAQAPAKTNTGIEDVVMEQSDGKTLGDLLPVTDDDDSNTPSIFTADVLNGGGEFNPYQKNIDMLNSKTEEERLAFEKQEQDKKREEELKQIEENASKPEAAADTNKTPITEVKRDPATIAKFFESSTGTSADGNTEDVTKGRIVTLKPKPRKGPRLGLENQKEQYHSMPGAITRWAPQKKGERYLTGFPRSMTIKELDWLEAEVGRKLIDRTTGTANPEYYRTLSILLDRNRTIGEQLNLSVARDRIIFYAMTQSDIVASSAAELEKKSFAEWYIEDVEVESEVESKERDERFQASALLRSLAPSELVNLGKAAGLAVSNLSPNAVRVKIERFLETPKEELKNARFINALYKRGSTHLRLAALIKDAIAIGVITRGKNQDYMYGTTIFGATEDQVIEKLNNPINQDVRQAIQLRVETAGVSL